MRIHVLALAALALLAPAASPAAAQTLMGGIFDYECRQANADKLSFTCETEEIDGKLWPTFSQLRKPDARDEYRLSLLVLRFFQAGGRHFTQLRPTFGQQRVCSNGLRKRGGYGLSCTPWQKVE
jgi:hypothetical protein